MKNSIQKFKNLFSAFKNLRFFQLKKNNHSIFTRSFSLRFCVVAALSLLVFNGCTVEEESATQNEAFAKNQTQLISDGANGGTEGFYFLPPMVKSPSYNGTFDAGLSPIVEICETEDCANILASYSMTQGTGSEIVRLDNDSEHYIVNWHTQNTNTPAGETYHLRIRVDDVVLGYAWVAITSTGPQAVALRANGYIAIIYNQTLPVKFRIETGIEEPETCLLEIVAGSVAICEIYSPAPSTLHVRGQNLLDMQYLELHSGWWAVTAFYNIHGCAFQHHGNPAGSVITWDDDLITVFAPILAGVTLNGGYVSWGGYLLDFWTCFYANPWETISYPPVPIAP